MRKTSSEAEIEFTAIGREVDHLKASLDRFRARCPDARSQEGWEAAHICASAVEKIYTGFERIMARIVREMDGTPIDRAEGWHRSLLRRVAEPASGRRPAVISDACFRRLDRLRAFRHRERNTYGLDLDLAIVLERSTEVVEAFDVFRGEVRAFFDRGAETAVAPPDVPPG